MGKPLFRGHSLMEDLVPLSILGWSLTALGLEAGQVQMEPFPAHHPTFPSTASGESAVFRSHLLRQSSSPEQSVQDILMLLDLDPRRSRPVRDCML
ncbi:hypothetical protein BT69DRAFT_1285191 [Atractiella rhizophila]|nr:hypothetical protein BT69DRAFT_1285191 [Atractiella rhizophila]